MREIDVWLEAFSNDNWIVMSVTNYDMKYSMYILEAESVNTRIGIRLKMLSNNEDGSISDVIGGLSEVLNNSSVSDYKFVIGDHHVVLGMNDIHEIYKDNIRDIKLKNLGI